MDWVKRGWIYAPSGHHWWARRYASFPTPELLGDVIRIYSVSLDDSDVGRTGYIEVAVEDPARIVYESPEPVLDIGAVGDFDDCGANVFSVLTHDGAKYLYYQGWQRTERAPYLIFSGLAIDDGLGRGVSKHSRAPILDRIETDRYIRGAPFVLLVEGTFRMWYASCRRWTRDAHGLHYEVGIRHASSSDGIHWRADETACLVPTRPHEYAVGRPCVLVEEGLYRMWYSIRSLVEPYRLGYAESVDGMTWTRLDERVGIERSSEGWDSEMLCYGHVIRIEDRLLMFYNGNQHGRSGFGYAQATA
jgi:hypothetical protein